MNNIVIRTFVLILHAVINFLLVNYILNHFDLTGRWLSFIGFILLAFLLSLLFITHIVSYIYFLKTKTK